MLSRRRPPLTATPNVGGSRFLFLGGLHRSGTSILHDLMRDHPDASGISNSGAPHDEGQHLQSVLKPASKFGGPGRFALSDGAHVTESDRRVGSTSRDTLLREWGPWFDLEKRVLLEKSPPNIVRSRFMQALLPGSRFAFIIRHPVAVTLATVKWSKNSIPDLLEHWLVAHEILLNDLAYLEHKIVFRYEDFVVDPDFFVGKICDLSGVTRIPASKPTLDHNAAYFDTWSRQAGDSDLLLKHVSPELQGFAASLGYSFTEPFVYSPGTEVLARTSQA